jgi:PPOX class probable F420-dependent enzyme
MRLLRGLGEDRQRAQAGERPIPRVCSEECCDIPRGDDGSGATTGHDERMAFELTQQIERHLVSDQLAWLTTVTPTGWPAPKPVWFVWDGTAITVYNLNTGAKLRHIAANDKVSLHFDSGPGGGDIVVISGRASLVPDAPAPSKFPGLLDKYTPALDAMRRDAQWYDDAYGAAIRIVPERAWAIS